MTRLQRKLLRDERGAAIIELALIAPIFALMTIGVVDMSNAYNRKLALEQGAQRAVEKIMQTTQDKTVEDTLKSEVQCQVNGFVANSTTTCATTPVALSDVVVTWRLECTDASGTMTPQSSEVASTFDNFVCAAGSTPARYLQVAVNSTYSPMFPVRFFSFNTTDGTYHLSATAGMRTQ